MSEIIRGKWVWCSTEKKLVPATKAEIVRVHSIITDEISPMMNHLNGQVYTSKSKYMRDIRQAGYDVLDSTNPADWRQEVEDKTNYEKALYEAWDKLEQQRL